MSVFVKLFRTCHGLCQTRPEPTGPAAQTEQLHCRVFAWSSVTDWLLAYRAVCCKHQPFRPRLKHISSIFRHAETFTTNPTNPRWFGRDRRATMTVRRQKTQLERVAISVHHREDGSRLWPARMQSSVLSEAKPHPCTA